MFVEATEAEVERQRLEAELAEACGQLNAATARVVSLLGRVLATGVWEQSGIHSPSHWAAWQCGLAPGRARRFVAMARRLEVLPHTRAAFAAGELSGDQVGPICRRAPTHTDAEMVRLAKAATVSQLTRTLRRYAFVDDAGEAVAPEPTGASEDRRVDFGEDEEGRWRLRATLPPDEGALVQTALRAARQEGFTAADQGDEVTWADALVNVAERSLASMAEARPHRHRHRHRHRVLLHMDLADVDHRIQLHLGSVVPDWVGRFLACDVDVTPVLEARGRPVSVGRTQRTVPDRTRSLVEHRDGGCRVPGCDRSRWLHVHHIVHWQDGGPTDTANLCCLCPAHHRLHHRGGLGITGDADRPNGLRFTDDRGRPLPACGRPRPPNRPPPAVAPYVHPLGERLDSRWVWFSPPPSPN